MSKRTHTLNFNNFFYCLKFTLSVAFCFFTWFVAIYIWNASALSHILFASLPISLAFILLLLRMATVQRERRFYIWIYLKMITTWCMISFHFAWFCRHQPYLKWAFTCAMQFNERKVLRGIAIQSTQMSL